MRKILGILIFLGALCCPKGALGQAPIRVNCGGPSYTDSRGQVWAADYGYNEGTASTITSPITGTSDPALYQDGRYNGNAGVPMTYSFPVANSAYHVNLYFTETVKSLQFAGARVFTVKMQGNTVFDHLDIFAEAGPNAALVKGADVLPGTSGPYLTLNFKYPDGTPVAGTLAYAISSSLLNFKGSNTLLNGSAQCVLLTNPSALGISTQFQANLSLTDSAGHVLWQMTLGLNPSQVNLGGVQSSTLNVVVQKM
jgi:hypothetical protein